MPIAFSYMHFLGVVAVAAQLASIAAVDVRSIKHASSAAIVPNSYIVELASGSHLKRGFSTPHEELYHDLRRRGASWEATKEYSDPILTGVVVKLGSDEDLPKLAHASGVRSISPIYLHPAPKPVSKHILQDNVGNGSAPGDVLSTHVMTGVDKLHAEGYFGKGITIGIIDTGIDYTHPALGGGFGPGNKVIGGYDFVGDAYTGMPDTPPPVPDNDPLDQCVGHGTHVAGILGANPNNPYNISGVAYESSINAYRVFGCDGSVPDDIVIDALLRAYRDGNDIITLSLGGPDGWTEAASGVIASRIADQGVIVTVAADNDGKYGSWYASGPGTGLNVISVGSVNNTVIYLQSANVSNGRKINYRQIEPIPIPPGLPLYATSSDVNVTNDACDPLPASTPDLSNYLVIIRRGTCTFLAKLDNAARFGARYFLIYDNLDQPLSSISTGNYTATLISQQDGIFLVQQGIPQNLTVSFANSPTTIPAPGAGLVSSFSSYGPSNDMYLKPAVTAPGGSILSTYPVTLGSYAVFSGTSMAAPFVAGSSALLLQIRGKTIATAVAARAIFENTAVPAKQTADDTSLIEAAGHQGAGLINVYDAVKNTGSLLPAEILLNDTAYFKGAHTLLIRNGGASDVTYTFSHVAAGTANTINGTEAILGPVPLVSNAASVTIVPSQVVVPAGGSLPVNVTFEAPTGLNASSFPVYSGHIKAVGSDNSTLQSTYIGVAANLKDAKILDNTANYFGVKLPLITDSAGDPVPEGGSANYTMIGSNTPMLLYRCSFGTPMFQLDLINANANVTANTRRSVEAEKRSGPLTVPSSTWDRLFASRRAIPDGTFATIQTLGLLYQEGYIPRNSAANSTDDNGYYAIQVSTFANGTVISDGLYKILLRALKVTGNPMNEGDYEVWTSPTVVVRRI